MATNDLTSNDTPMSPSDDTTATTETVTLGPEGGVGPDGRPRGGVVDLTKPDDEPTTRGRPRGGVVDA